MKISGDQTLLPFPTMSSYKHVNFGWDDAKAASLDPVGRLIYRSNLLGGDQRITVQVHLGDLAPEAVRVELYADPRLDGPPERHIMAQGRTLDDAGAGYEYSVTIPAVRAPGDYTPRLLPSHPDAAIPLEAPSILWQR